MAPNKAFIALDGQPLVAYSLDAFESVPEVDSLILVAGEHTMDHAESLRRSGRWRKLQQVVRGGDQRQASVAAGLDLVSPEARWVAIHDGARPLIQPSMISRCIQRAWETGAAIAAIPVNDSLKQVSDDLILASIPRDGVWAAQTPQVFRKDILNRAFQDSERRGARATDEATLVEALGHRVAVVTSSPLNLKITTPDDLVVAEGLLSQLRAASGSSR